MGVRLPSPAPYDFNLISLRGSSSVVEYHLAKVEVAGSNPVFRSKCCLAGVAELADAQRSEEHTSELQSRGHIVCRLLLDKKKTGMSATIVQPALIVLH